MKDASVNFEMQTILEGIPYPAMILDRGFRIVDMNRRLEALTGYEVDSVQGIFGELVVRSNTGNSRGQLYIRAVETGKSFAVAGDILSRFRTKIPVLYNIAPLKKDQECQGLLVIAEDISARSGGGESTAAAIDTSDLIAQSSKMQKVLDMIPLLAHTDASVLITGETGTGKDKIAEVIHRESERAGQPFIKVNCGALPTELLESELFGHVKGAFTGATRNKQGMFKLADRGTLFLTEIGDMPLSLQVKLLSVLDDRKFIPVGGEQSVEVNVRIIAATHRPLRQQVARGEFREDLFYRLNVLHVHLPPVRERQRDVELLLHHFLHTYNQRLNKSITGFSAGVSKLLHNYKYPGNIRELRNIVEYCVNVCPEETIRRQHIPVFLFNAVEEKREVVTDENTLSRVETCAPQSRNDEIKAGESWGAIERQMIVEMLTRHGGSRKLAAEELGWGRMKLWRRMKKYELL
ncbi:sigma-54 interaction domain-containing protein [Desulfosediminicola ganghwensis]|uniref:sigma-54 interaction domain-containing protein n=1 Tax=Desulfosediminicola ganghwensis TaxID=2569540 RepID=UPI0010AD5EF4|nr:sigma 54-interacting transcriptional regulator [Desulfosediminicola ganghwensis]